MVAIIAVELTAFIGLALAGQLVFAVAEYLVGIAIIAIYFLPLFRRVDRLHREKIHLVNDLIGKIQNGDTLDDLDTFIKDDKDETKQPAELRKVVRFGVSCFALSAILFGIQFILIYFQSVINGTSSTYVQSVTSSVSSYVNWVSGVAIAVFFGGLMIGALILVIPWDQLEKSAMIRRGKKLAGL